MAYPQISENWQRALKLLGVYDGAIDGVRGPKTNAAINKIALWQTALKEHGFDPGAIDGWPGDNTYKAMQQCRDWQSWLNQNSFRAGSIDSYPGTLTEAAIKRFQVVAGIGADGVVGPATIAARQIWPTRPAVTVPTNEGAKDKLRRLALAQVGKPYVWGAIVSGSDPNPKSFDCSELVEWLYRQCYSRDVGDWTVAQEAAFTTALTEPTEIGDVFFMGPKGRSWHVGIYVGNGQVVESRGRAYGVVLTTVAAINKRGGWWRRLA